MKHLKKLLTLFLAILMVAMLPTTALAKMPNVAQERATTDEDNLIDYSTVRLVQCLSAATHFPEDDTEALPFSFGEGYMFSVIPGTTFVPAHYASFLHGFDPWSENNPAKVYIAYNRINWRNPLGMPDACMALYPFRLLAESLGYDVLWRNIDGEGYVFFAEHVEGGVWIHVSLENLILPKDMGMDLSGIKTKDHGWMYANSITIDGDYNVQFDRNGEVAVPWYWVTEVVTTN